MFSRYCSNIVQNNVYTIAQILCQYCPNIVQILFKYHQNIMEFKTWPFLCICLHWLLDKNTGRSEEYSTVAPSRRQGVQWNNFLSLCDKDTGCIIKTSPLWCLLNFSGYKHARSLVHISFERQDQ